MRAQLIAWTVMDCTFLHGETRIAHMRIYEREYEKFIIKYKQKI